MAQNKDATIEIQLLGSDLTEYRQNLDQALAQTGAKANIVQIGDAAQIANLGVMQTPGLVVDGAVKAYGKVLSVEQLISVLK